MQTIGEKLLEARQRQGLSIREAAESTKVRGEFLDAMESNQFERIGLAEVYRRGFLKIYAKFLRLDPDRLLGEYNSQMRPGQVSGRRSSREVFGLAEPGSDKGVLSGGTEEGRESDYGFSALESANHPGVDRRKLFIYAAYGVLALFVALVLFNLASCGESEPAPTPQQNAAVPQYTFQLYVDGDSAAEVKIVQELDGKVVFNGLVTTNTNRMLMAQGALIITSNNIAKVRIQVGANPKWLGVTDGRIPSFRVPPPQ